MENTKKAASITEYDNKRPVTRMKTSTEIWSAAKIIGEERAIEYYARAGFDAYDFSMFEMARYDKTNKCLSDSSHPLSGSRYLAFARRLRTVAEDNGIVCNQSHAPFPTSVGCVRDHLKRAIECTAEAGGEYCIIHPANNGTPEENAELFLSLIPFAREHGVKIATENMWNWDREHDCACFAACATPESFNAHLDAVGDEYLVACLDIGHAEMYGCGTSAPEMIEALGNRLRALHIHDNDRRRDSHQIPFSMNIDFDSVVRSLKRIGYCGYLTLEADAYLSAYTEDNVFEGMCALAESARRLALMFE